MTYELVLDCLEDGAGSCRNEDLIAKLRTELALEIAAKHEFQKAWLIALDERDTLRGRITELTICDCGLPLSTGQCGICDNDE